MLKRHVLPKAFDSNGFEAKKKDYSLCQYYSLYLAETVGFTRIASRSAVLGSPSGRLRTTRCSEVRRTSELTLVPFRVRIPTITDKENEGKLCFSSFSLAETVGFEPTVPRRYTAFRVRLVITTSIRLLIRLCRHRFRRTDKSDFIIFSCLFQGLSDAADEILIVTLPERSFNCRH